ncbi:hypothetical protein QVD17_35183 [Tagetes erecta]|uniref:Vacuolar protein sorting-associated protein 62 n=1 Tax=Tagetes erecta TaxID=13708 RepID=A0AAD8K5E0_TARER|nr:hypothetical protein QVD17_35183 [Tagetes erecta]
MSSGQLLSRLISFDRFKTTLIIFHIVCYTSCAYNDFSTLLDHNNNNSKNNNNNVQDDTEVVSFDIFGPSPIYSSGGVFGSGGIDLGGLEVFEALYFKKIWDTQSGGPGGVGASFYEPTSIPTAVGFHLLGHYCKLNNVDMFAAVLTAKDTTNDPSHAALKSPVDYTLVWTSKGVNVTQLEDGYIWLPIAPDGYKAVGHVVTTSPEKPLLDKVKCVRSDFTDLTEVDSKIWVYKLWGSSNMVHIYTTKPKNVALSVPAGTFLALNGSSTHELACLKMTRSDPYFAMPDSLQIRTMINAYAPWVYFHPDERFFPSSVLWFFQNGVQLHETNQTPQAVINDGDNLPSNLGPDDAFLDLPPDQPNHERVKEGFLRDAVAYIHVKPALGGTYTDLAIWLYYPFNGGGTFQLGPFTIHLGKIGQHVSDWEHMTLRIDNFRGILKAVYLSQHAKGKWVRPRKFELMNGTRPVVYASLHGHSHYSTPKYHIHTAGHLDSNDTRMLYDAFQMNNSRKSPIVEGEKFLGFGLRDDAAKSNNVMDIASSYNVVCVDYKDIGTEPWLNYAGSWGPRITYGFTKEVIKMTKKLPRKVRNLAIRVLHKLPPELLGEEGPQGPKMKESWTGDERV